MGAFINSKWGFIKCCWKGVNRGVIFFIKVPEVMIWAHGGTKRRKIFDWRLYWRLLGNTLSTLQTFISALITCLWRFTKRCQSRHYFHWRAAGDDMITWMPQNTVQTITLIASFMGPTWGPPEADRTQVGPLLATRTLLSGLHNITQLNDADIRQIFWIV